MRLSKLGPMLAFATSVPLALLYWPAGCAHPSPPAAETPPAPDVVQTRAANTSFLPHPAFAYAKGNDGASIADVAAKALPSVVNIASTKITQSGFRNFFGPRGPERQEGMGSGVIVSKDGVVLTNNHVVEGAQEIKVTTADKREFDAEVVGTDPKSDLAVIRLQGDPKNLRPLGFGDSSRLRLGDVVLAIGNPFGVGQTVTMGIVSAKGRANVGIVDYEDFIQTDAAINPGNSGGALVDMEGNLVGINTAILSRSGGNMGIGFAIPTNMAKPIMQSLLDDGKVVRGWLGVSIQDIDQDLAGAMKLGTTQGVLIADVGSDTPAAKGGIRRGDVVTSVDGKKVDSTGRLRNVVAAAGAGKTVRVQLLRGKKKLTKQVKLGQMPDGMTRRGPIPSAPSGAGKSLDGLTLEGLNRENRKRFDIPPSVKGGVVVSRVQRGSSAARAGLRPGDVVLEVDRHAVRSVADLEKRWNAAQGPTPLLVYRDGHTAFLVVQR